MIRDGSCGLFSAGQPIRGSGIGILFLFFFFDTTGYGVENVVRSGY
jgi:hypothetical protein